MARWVGDRPEVSVLCPTYQHGAFIEEALLGFLGQDTDFPFEVIVRDDASTDGTEEIVRHYADRFPNVIRAVLETENTYKHVSPGQVLLPLANGEFIASCEGDDYWTDPSKLQTQRDGLVQHPEFVASHHAVTVVRSGIVIRPEKRSSMHCRDFTSHELARGARIITSSVLRRNVSMESVGPRRFAIDLWTRARLGLHGGARWEATVGPAVHRLHDGGIWSSRSEVERARSQRELFRGFAEEFALSGHDDLSRHYRRLARTLHVYACAADLHPAFAAALGVVRRRAWGA